MPVIKVTHQCKPHDYQDEHYGVNMRLMNPMVNNQHRCTVCGREQS